MCRLQFYRNIQKKSTNPSIRTLVSTLQCRFLCVFLILPYAHSANSVARSGIGAQISEDERYGRVQRVDVGAFHAMGRVDARADERTADIVSGTQRRAPI